MPSLTALRGLDAQAMARALDLKDTDIGYLLIDAESGEEIAASHADTSYPPASTAKIVTAVAALGVLGPDFRFSTDVWARGTLKDGVLDGDLILIGDGDPLLSMGDLRALAQQVRDFGVRRVDGRFLYHGTLPAFPVVDADQPLKAAYNQAVGGIALDFNRVNAWPGRLTPVEADGLATVPDDKPIYARDVPLRDPSLFAARMLRRFAAAEGTTLPEPAAGALPERAVPLARIVSQPLIDVLRSGLEYSNNMIAENVGLATAMKLGPAPGTLYQSAIAGGIWLERHIDGLSRFAQNVRNHSGLSTRSRVTPRQMTTILRHALKARFDGWRIDALLPPAGGREGYHGRFKDDASAYRLWGKTGTMRYIKGLVGYLDTQGGRRLIAAIYVFDEKARRSFDVAGRPETGPLVDAARTWKRRAERFEEGLITAWISAY